jgi:hypothetical protein
MKNLFSLFAALMILLFAEDVAAQCSKNCKGCSKKHSSTKNTGMNSEETSKALSCKLTSPELRKRKEEVIAQLKKEVIEKKELSDGFSYKFSGTDEMLDTLTAFIKSERQCCDFFNFRLTVNADSAIWLDITGPENVKEFITAELEM